MRIFHGFTTDFKKTIIWKKATSITKSCEFSRTCIFWLRPITDEKLIPWYCVNVTMTLCKHYYGNIMNMFQRKYLILQWKKKTTSKKEGIIRLQSDLRFLINTYEGLSFQWSFFPRQDHTTHRNMKSLILTYIFEESSYKFIVFFTIIHVPKQAILVFYVIRWNSNLKQQCNKVKKDF